MSLEVGVAWFLDCDGGGREYLKRCEGGGGGLLERARCCCVGGLL